MSKRSTIVAIATLTILMGGCGSDNQSETPTPTETAQKPKPPAAQPKPQNFPKPTTPAKTEPVATLIPSTNAQKRTDQVQKGRQDPFALIPDIRPIVKLEVDKTKQAEAGQVPKVPPVPSNKGTATAPTKPNGATKPTNTNQSLPDRLIPGKVQPGQGTGLKPPTVPGVKPGQFVPELPVLPEPTLAKAVEVTGVIEVNGVVHAIVKSPDEKSSRYVQAGQYLSNGQILIKRIEMNRGPVPVVILEQFGMEVARQVGAPAEGLPEKGQPGGTTTAMLPMSPLPVPALVN